VGNIRFRKVEFQKRRVYRLQGMTKKKYSLKRYAVGSVPDAIIFSSLAIPFYRVLSKPADIEFDCEFFDPSFGHHMTHEVLHRPHATSF
jgi:hypothetical protein